MGITVAANSNPGNTVCLVGKVNKPVFTVECFGAVSILECFGAVCIVERVGAVCMVECFGAVCMLGRNCAV